ncbi:hypothetical protein O0I10_006826 [Lichtheimia ornata]|uniref:Uncharacterized protein n=1 Tax=Lichtheimia ornata TaxID=688661 RepID=A0AAD7V2E4_9FUNG|nr:uncharacterized protein O0I10_006826 [Lichtheimia ornata]KAJ8657524.1 hypothetical protein O0I10_006826 [Lichtheimia ornata]
MADVAYIRMDDATLKMRLAMDDRQIKNLQKKASAWMSNLSNEPIETAQYSYETMLLFLASYQTSIERHPLLQQANAEDVEGYGVIGDQTAKQVGSTAEQIASLKDELKEAQRIRNNKLEYDVVAREIMQLEERATYHDSIRQLQEDIEMLKREKAKKDEAFEERKRNFSGFISNIKELQQTIERERAEGHEMQKMLMDMDRGYESSDEENENDNENTPSQSADVLTNGATSHRFNERNEDEDEDEEGMVLDSEEVVVSGTH